MDAAQKLIHKSGLYLVMALLFTAPGWAQPTFVLSTNNLTCSGTICGQVNVDSTGAAITYTIGASDYSADAGNTNGTWLRTSPTGAGQTTPSVISFGFGSLSLLPPGQHTATVTLHATDGSGAPDVTITVNFNSTTGGGGSFTLSSSINPIVLGVATNGVVSQQISITTTSASPINITPSFSTTSGGNWLNVTNQGSSSIFNGSGTTLLVTVAPGGLGTGSYGGTVTVTPSSGTTLNIPVTMNVNGATGGASLTPSQNSLSWSFTTNSGIFPTPVNVSVTASSGITFYNYAVSSFNGWLAVNGSTTGFNGNSTSTVMNFAPNGAAMNTLATGTYTGTVTLYDNANPSVLLNTITVTLTVNGGSTTGLSVSPNPISFNSGTGGFTQQQSVTVSSTSGGNLSLAATTSSGGAWLSFGTFSSPLGAGGSTSFQVFANPAGLPAGTYFGTLTVTVGTQAIAVSVTFVVGTGGGGGGGSTSVAPTSLSFTWVAGSSPSSIARQSIAIAGPAGQWNTSVSTNTGGNWISLSPVSGNLPDLNQTTVVIAPFGLVAGTYTGNITITTPGGSVNVSVNLSVISAGPLLIPNPGSLIFNYSTGFAVPPAQQVNPYNSDNSSLSFTTAAADPWVIISQPAGATAFTVSVDPTGKTAGIYTSSVTLTEGFVTNSPVTMPVVLNINGGGVGSGGTLGFVPSSLSFISNAGSTPATQTLAVTASVASTFTVTTSSTATWLTVTPTSGTTPTNLSVFVNPAGLVNGTYTGTITFNSNGGVQNVGVTFTVSGVSNNSGNVTVTCSGTACGTTQPNMAFTGQTGAGTLPAGSLSVASASGTAGVNFQVAVTTTSGGSWLSTSAAAFQTLTTPATLTVTVNTANLAAGTYAGNIRITPTGGTVVNVPVSLTLTAPPVVSASPTVLSFTYRAGDNQPAPQAINVTGGSGTLPFTASASSSGNWLSVTPTSGTTPATVNASVNGASLNPGTYSGTITVSGTGSALGTTSIAVTLTVTAPLPTIARLGNAGSYIGNSISPGEIITLFAPSDGRNPIGPATPVGLQLDSTGKVATTLGGVQVLIGGIAAPLTYVSASQVSAIVPYEVAPLASVSVLVRYLGQGSNGVLVPVTTTAPGLFTLNSSGTGPAAALNQNNSTNSPGNPAARGETVVLFLTGEGQTQPAGVTGKVTTISSTPPITPAPLLPIAITIGGVVANYTFAGEAPNFVSGVLQLNVQIPLSAGTGDQQIVVSIGSNPSQTGVTVSIR